MCRGAKGYGIASLVRMRQREREREREREKERRLEKETSIEGYEAQG
jgi:hypothetical protein